MALQYYAGTNDPRYNEVLDRARKLVADAEVRKVHRSQAGLKAGEPVRIMYRFQNTNPHFKSIAGE